MDWTVTLHKRVHKALKKLPNEIQDVVNLLVGELENDGPVRGNWPNYSKLDSTRHHCHMKKGKPTYVAVWEELEGELRIIEVTYVGSHENAPY